MPIQPPSMTRPIAAILDVPFDEAIDSAKARDVLLPAEYYDQVQAAARAASFTVSHLSSLRQIGGVLDALVEVLKEGLTFTDFTKRVEADGVDLTLPHRETVFRTGVQTAYNAGRRTQQVANAENRQFLMYDAINDSRTRPTHRAMDGYIAPVGDEVWGRWTPPAGFNSILPWQRVSGRVSLALKANYSGQIVEVRTRSGDTLSLTAQHPVLTARGWVAAAEIQIGEKLLRYAGVVNDGATPASANENDLPPTIKEVFDTLALRGSASMPRAAFNLYGDVKFIDGDVDVVGASRQLVDRLYAEAIQFVDKLSLMTALHGFVSLPRDGGARVVSRGEFCKIAHALHALAQSGFAFSFDEQGSFVEFDPNAFQMNGQTLAVDMMNRLKLAQSPASDPLFDETSRDWLSEPGRRAPHLDLAQEGVPLGFGPLRDSAISNVFLGGFGINPDAHRDLLDRHPGRIEFDEAINLRFRDYSGHVYDLETKAGVIVTHGGHQSNQTGLIVSNCRCSCISLTERQARARGYTGFTPPPQVEPDPGWGHDPAARATNKQRLDQALADAQAEMPPAIRRASGDYLMRGARRDAGRTP